MIKAAVIFTVMTSSVLAQSSQTPATLVAVGYSYNTSANPVTRGPFESVLVQISGTRTYSITTLDEAPRASGIRSGVGRVVLQVSRFTLLAHADGGISSTVTSSLASFSGGCMAVYRVFGKTAPVSNVYLFGAVRIISTSSVATKPSYEFGLAYSK